MEPLLENAFRNTSATLTTPSAPLRWLRIFFLMAQPPLLSQEGCFIASLTISHSFSQRRGPKLLAPNTTPFFSGPNEMTTAVLANTTSAVSAIAFE
jgi:hypothetical protein